MSSLTREQLQKIEANRQLALKRRNERLAVQEKSAVPSFRADVPKQNIYPTSNQLSPITTFYCSANISGNVKTHFNSNKKQSSKVITGNCRLITRDRFTVVVPYHERLIDIFKSIPGKVYGKYFVNL